MGMRIETRIPVASIMPTSTTPFTDTQALAVIQQLTATTTALSATQIGISIVALILIWGMFELLWHVIDLRSSL